MKIKLLFAVTISSLFFSGCSVMNTVSTIASGPTTPHLNLAVQAVECVRNGDNVNFTFLLQNNGVDIKEFLFVSAVPGNVLYSKAIDNMGNTYPVFTSPNKYALPTGVPVKITVRVSNVRPDAQQLRLIQMLGRTDSGYDSYMPKGDFVFRNIEIQ